MRARPHHGKQRTFIGSSSAKISSLRRLRLRLAGGRRRDVRRRRPPPGESLNRGRHLDGGRSLREAGRRGRISLGRAAGRLGNLVLHGGGQKVGSEVGGNEERRRRTTHTGRWTGRKAAPQLSPPLLRRPNRPRTGRREVDGDEGKGHSSRTFLRPESGATCRAPCSSGNRRRPLRPSERAAAASSNWRWRWRRCVFRFAKDRPAGERVVLDAAWWMGG